jgi:hypothetical protein
MSGIGSRVGWPRAGFDRNDSLRYGCIQQHVADIHLELGDTVLTLVIFVVDQLELTQKRVSDFDGQVGGKPTRLN